MKQVVVLKQFRYSVDGINSTELAAGEVLNIRDDLFAGLLRERFIQEVVDRPSVMIPDAPPPQTIDEPDPVGVDPQPAKRRGRPPGGGK